MWFSPSYKQRKAVAAEETAGIAEELLHDLESVMQSLTPEQQAAVSKALQRAATRGYMFANEGLPAVRLEQTNWQRRSERQETIDLVVQRRSKFPDESIRALALAIGVSDRTVRRCLKEIEAGQTD